MHDDDVHQHETVRGKMTMALEGTPLGYEQSETRVVKYSVSTFGSFFLVYFLFIFRTMTDLL